MSQSQESTLKEKLKVRKDSIKRELEDIKFHEDYIQKENVEIENMRSLIQQKTKKVKLLEDYVRKKKDGLQEEMKDIEKMEMMELESASGAPVWEYKLLILGDNGIGKSTFLKRFETDKEMFVNEGGGHIHSLRFSTNRGTIKFNVCDNRGLSSCDGNYKESQGAIIMFDVKSRITYKNVSSHHHDLTRVCGSIPIVLVGNKIDCDIQDRKVKANQITFHRKVEMPYCDVSALEGDKDSVTKPFLWLARKLTGDNTLYFVEAP